MKTKEELIDFEKWTVETFNSGQLRSPVHLAGGNEDQLIEIFKQIKPQDWCFTTYRSHYHALLKGVPEQRLKDWILDNKSIHFMDSEYKVFSSAIVGGTLPIALGTAMAIKRDMDLIKSFNSSDKIDEEDMPGHVYCFIGDMTSRTGGFRECYNYAVNFDLPITFIIEDNGLSTDTKTGEVWNLSNERFYSRDLDCDLLRNGESEKLLYYQYNRVYPHYGTGKFIDSIWKDLKDNPKAKGF